MGTQESRIWTEDGQPRIEDLDRKSEMDGRQGQRMLAGGRIWKKQQHNRSRDEIKRQSVRFLKGPRIAFFSWASPSTPAVLFDSPSTRQNPAFSDPQPPDHRHNIYIFINSRHRSSFPVIISVLCQNLRYTLSVLSVIITVNRSMQISGTFR